MFFAKFVLLIVIVQNAYEHQSLYLTHLSIKNVKDQFNG